MLPEILSNDLCSLHPGTTKLTLSCVMMIDRHGYVEHTDIVEGIIESQHRGVYDDIASRYTELQKSTTNSVKTTDLDTTIQTAFDLYYSLEKRRRKEGKIAFESTEIYFDFGDTDPANQIAKTPKGIKGRERNDAHKLIEECMVLANEEVAKWCHAA